MCGRRLGVVERPTFTVAGDSELAERRLAGRILKAQQVDDPRPLSSVLRHTDIATGQ
jgi:hypothetical protein